MRLSLAAAAVVLTAAAVPLTTSGPASAAMCDPGAGVSVVVDFGDLGGGTQSVCDPAGGGTKAATLFTRHGFELTYAQRQPGYVCRVQNVPVSDPCVNTSPANAFWGLWWSDGKKGTWTYAALGAQSLTIPAGGSVAFAWDDVDGQVTPGVAPPKQAAANPTPTPAPSVKPTLTATPSPQPSPTATGRPTPSPLPVVTPTDSSTPSASASDTVTPTPTDSETQTATPTPSTTTSALPTTSEAPEVDDPEPSSTPADSAGGGLPTWIPIVVIAVIFGGAGAVMVRRRRGA